MSSDILFLLRIWYFQFFISMGGVLSAAVPLTLGVLLTHWLYLCARSIESKATPLSFPKAVLRLSGFQALVAGVVLVPFCTIGLFYVLMNLVWKLAPTMPATPSVDAPQINGLLPDFGSASADECFSSMASIVIYLVALTVIIGATIFLLLRHYAKRMDPEKVPFGLIKRVVRRYFHESTLVGFLLILIACPVILFYFYNIAWLVIFIFPSTAQDLSNIAFNDAENLLFRSYAVTSSWLLVILIFPAVWLLARGWRLRFRYIIENPTMNVIFARSFKLYTLGLLGFIGCTIMHSLANSFFRIITQVVF